MIRHRHTPMRQVVPVISTAWEDVPTGKVFRLDHPDYQYAAYRCQLDQRQLRCKACDLDPVCHRNTHSLPEDRIAIPTCRAYNRKDGNLVIFKEI